jgi:preprotein translocase subunit SecY
MLVVFRIAAHIPLPGINQANLQKFFQDSQVFGFINIFSGGAMENFSIVALGIAPYITASIIFQLLTMIVPALEALSKDGESGYKKINQYTRLLTIPLALLQAYGLVTILKKSGQNIIGDLAPLDLILIVLTLTAGTVFLMWIGELISERKIGNGVSLLIFAGIIAQLPVAIVREFSFENIGDRVVDFVIFSILVLVTIVGVVIITEAQKRVPISYAKRIRGNKMYGGTNTYLPLRINQAGVIPIIFAVSIVLFPPIIAQFFQHSSIGIVKTLAEFTIAMFNNNLVYGILYFILVFMFTYFYTAVIFQPIKIAEHLQKQGGFIPGIRPGVATVEYLSTTVNRLILAGALFLGIIAILPLIAPSVTSIKNVALGGTSLLIVVSVIIETVQQIDAQLTSRDYEGI